MKKPSEVFKNIRFAKLDPKHDKGHKGGSTDDEEHGAVSEIEWNQQLAHQKKRAMQEDLRKWFSKTDPEGGWKRINSKGEAIGPCAREPGEPKPKCMSNEKRAALSKKERASAVASKRKHDPNPERKGEPINVSNFGKGKISEDMENLEEKNVPTSPEKWAQAKSQAKAKFDVYPSAYANGWAAKKYKEMGGGWKSVSEQSELGESKDMKAMRIIKDIYKRKSVKEETDTVEKNEMVESQLHFIKYACEEILEYIEMGGEIEEWYQVKVAKSFSEFESLHAFMEGESRRLGMKEEVEQIEELSKDTLKSYSTKATNQIIDKNVDTKTKEKRHGGLGKSLPKLHSDSDKTFKVQYKEEVELEEGKMKDIATNREEDKRLGSWRKETPWMKVKSTVTDKSGAKHTPMSRARDLARSAAKKNVKESVSITESRLADIVREAAEKAKKKKKEETRKSDDTFQAEPELSSQIIRND
jgi:hypothetical protein